MSKQPTQAIRNPIDEHRRADVSTLRANARASPERGERFAILIECETEAEQVELLERLVAEGRKCRSLIA